MNPPSGLAGMKLTAAQVVRLDSQQGRWTLMRDDESATHTARAVARMILEVLDLARDDLEAQRTRWSESLDRGRTESNTTMIGMSSMMLETLDWIRTGDGIEPAAS